MAGDKDGTKLIVSIDTVDCHVSITANIDSCEAAVDAFYEAMIKYGYRWDRVVEALMCEGEDQAYKRTKSGIEYKKVEDE